VAALWAVIVGGIAGGLIMLRLTINRALWVFGFVQMVTILGFAWLSTVGHYPLGLFVVVSAEYFGVGLGTIALTAYIARETSKAFTATQFALFSSFIAVPRTFANASTGFLIEWMGYTHFFLLCTVVAVPGLLLLLKVAPWNSR
jgi:PAT family beta-lactamase induction signal transducer AmpG